MREKVGVCSSCEKDVFCLDGFLNGVYREGKLLCFSCAEATVKESAGKEKPDIKKEQ